LCAIDQEIEAARIEAVNPEVWLRRLSTRLASRTLPVAGHAGRILAIRLNQQVAS
jgi:hypothetical protein